MSRYECKLPNGRRLAYGLDQATAGYFCSESHSALELSGIVEIEIFSALYEGEALTLSSLITNLGDRYSLLLESGRVAELVADFLNGHPPTRIQRSTAQEYGVNLDASLQVVAQDLWDNFSEYL